MKKKLIVSILYIISAFVIFAQTDTLTLRAPAPQASFTISATATHPGGTSSFFYWVVARYPIGNVISNTPKFINNLPPVDAVNTVSVSWQVVPTAITYDLLRTTTNASPTTTCNCLVATGIPVTTFLDNVASPTTYTFNPGNANPVVSNTRLDNLNFSTARIVADVPWMFPQICFNDLTCQTTANSGALPPSGVIVGTYGDANNVGQFTVLNTGIITNAVNVPIASVGIGFAPSFTPTVATIATGQIRLDGGALPITTVFTLSGTITVIGGVDNATFFSFIDYNAGTPVKKCLISGGNIANYTVVNYSGATCAAGGNYPQDSVPIARFTVVGGVITAMVDDRAAGWGVYTAGTFLTKVGRDFRLDTTTGINKRMLPMILDGGGSALTAGTTKYFVSPVSCTIAAWNILADTGTATIKFWKIATGTAIPTVANVINTAGIGLSVGTAVRSTNVADFTTPNIVAADIIGVNLFAVASATFIYVGLECNQ